MAVAGARAVDYGLGRFVVISALVHLVILMLAFNLKPAEAPRLTFGPVHRVELVTAAGLTKTRPATTLAERGTTLSVPSRHPAISLRKPLDIAPVEPLRQLRPVRQEPQTATKAKEDLQAKAAVTPPAAPLAKASPPAGAARQTPAVGEGPPGGQAATQLNEAEIHSRMNAYYLIIWESVKASWTIPSAVSLRGNPQATVLVRISPQGRVSHVAFEEPSGQREFDESILRALRKASPFPPLPEWVQGGIEIGIRFRASDLNTI
jgi:TonB family protein